MEISYIRREVRGRPYAATSKVRYRAHIAVAEILQKSGIGGELHRRLILGLIIFGFFEDGQGAETLLLFPGRQRLHFHKLICFVYIYINICSSRSRRRIQTHLMKINELFEK